MRKIVIKQSLANKQLDKVIKELFPKMPVSAMYKAFRKKDVKLNGIRVKEDAIVKRGDLLELYILDEILDAAPQKSNLMAPEFSIIFEDKNVMIVNKPQGLSVHADKEQSNNTLIDLVLDYLKQKGEYNPSDPLMFTPALCHRLDRNTSGLVIIAKNNESLNILLDKIKNREVKKLYHCLVAGKMEKHSAELRAYLTKDERKSKVFITNNNARGSLEIITRYKTISFENDISLLEVELVTGRTHQIRAHLAYIGHPIIGDGKYGSNSINRALGIKRQCLCAYKIIFNFQDAGMLNYLKDKAIEIKPEFKIKGEGRCPPSPLRSSPFKGD